MVKSENRDPRSPFTRGFPLALTGLVMCGGCAGSLGTTARSMLAHVRDDPDPNIRFEAYSKLGKLRTYDDELQIIESVQELSAKLNSGKEPSVSRAMICRTLGKLKQPEGRDALVKAMEDPDDEVRCEAARALGHIGKPDDAILLTRMMAIDPTHNGRVAAAEGLANLKPNDPRVLISLTENLNNDDPAIRLASYRTLKSITGADPGSDANSWHLFLADAIPGYVDDPVASQATSLASKATKDAAVSPSKFAVEPTTQMPPASIMPPPLGGLPNP